MGGSDRPPGGDTCFVNIVGRHRTPMAPPYQRALIGKPAREDTDRNRCTLQVLRTDGLRVVRTQVRAPRANAVVERWVGTVRRECIDHVLIFGRRHLERVLRAYTEHYNRARPHRGLDLEPPDPDSTLGSPSIGRSGAGMCSGDSSTSTRRRRRNWIWLLEPDSALGQTDAKA